MIVLGFFNSTSQCLDLFAYHLWLKRWLHVVFINASPQSSVEFHQDKISIPNRQFDNYHYIASCVDDHNQDHGPTYLELILSCRHQICVEQIMASHYAYGYLVEHLDVIQLTAYKRSDGTVVNYNSQIQPHQALDLQTRKRIKIKSYQTKHYSSDDENQIVDHRPLAVFADIVKQSAKPALEASCIQISD